MSFYTGRLWEVLAAEEHGGKYRNYSTAHALKCTASFSFKESIRKNASSKSLLKSTNKQYVLLHIEIGKKTSHIYKH